MHRTCGDDVMILLVVVFALAYDIAYKPCRPKQPTTKLNSHYIFHYYSEYLFYTYLVLNSTHVWFCPPQYGLYSVREKNKAERVTSSPVDPGISRGVTDLYPSRGHTHPVTRAIEVSHAACKAGL